MIMGRHQKRSSLTLTTESSPSHRMHSCSTSVGSNAEQQEGGSEEGRTGGCCVPHHQGLSPRFVLLLILFLLIGGLAICAIVSSADKGSPAVILHDPDKQPARRTGSSTVTKGTSTIAAAAGEVTDHGTMHEYLEGKLSEYFLDARPSTSAIAPSATSFHGENEEGKTVLVTNHEMMGSEHAENRKVLAASTSISSTNEPAAPAEEVRPPYLLSFGPTSTRRTATKKETTTASKESPEDVARKLQGGDEVDCVLSQETPFVYRILVKLNSLNGTCLGNTGATTNGTLSENDKKELNNVILSSFSTLAEKYCDPYFRNVTSANIVREQVSLSDQPPSVTLAVQVMGTLRCRASELGCNVTKIGLFHSPVQVVDPQEQHQEATCSCPKVNNTALTATDRGPTEAEFMEHFGVRLATVAPSFDCPDLQAAECAFGTVFQSALAVTFADEDAARNASALIGQETLRTLNELYTPDDPSICYPEFRVFDSVSVVFQEAARRKLQEMVTPSVSPGANVSSPTSVGNGTEPFPIVNVTSAPSTSPSSIYGVPSSPQPLTAILYIDGMCSQCEGDLFFQDDVSARRRRFQASSFQNAMENRPGVERKLQTINTIKSNCFCPIDSVVAEVPGPGIDEFESTLAERLQLEITETKQVDPESVAGVNDGESFVNNGIYSYPCTNISSAFKKNVTLEVQVTCDSAPDLSDDDKNNIGLVYANAYNSIRTTVCDPFSLEVVSAKVVATGDLRAGGSSSSLPLRIEVTVICYGCDPFMTDVYGFPEIFLEEETADGINNETRYLRRSLQEVEDEGTCSCNSTLPRRSPLEADVTAAFDLISVQQQDLLPACIGNATTCDFGRTFTTSALLEVEGTLDPYEAASILEQAFTNALDGLIGGGNATQCNPLFGLVTDTQVYLDFVYNSVDRNANDTTARRQLQQDLLPTEAPTSDSTFTLSWSTSGYNITETPTTAPTVQESETAFFLLDASGVCNGCETDLIFNNNAVDGRRRLEEAKYEDEIRISSPLSEFRFLQDIAGEEPESECYCPIGTAEVVTNFDEISLLEVIQAEVAKITSNLTVTETVSGITKVDCVEQTPFSTTINFHFSAFEWVVNNPDDVQGLGDAIAQIYNGLVEEFCDEYFRSSISLTFVSGSLQRSTSTGRRHDRDLQSMQGCFNYRATFTVTGLCRGCEALGTPIPLFGNSTTNRKLDEITTRKLSNISGRHRRLQEAGSTCVCDSISITQRSAPSRAAINAGLEALIPDSLPWALNPSICGLPVDVEIPCPTIPAGPSATISLRFYARRTDGGCLKAADVQVLATQFLTTFNANMQLARFPCEPQYLQVSNVIIDPNNLLGCRRELLRGSKNDDGKTQQENSSRQLQQNDLQDFNTMDAIMTATGNIYAVNIDAILAGESSAFRAAAAGIEATSGGLYEIITGSATISPSAVPSAFPSSFPSAFPSELPSDEPSKSPSGEPSAEPSKSPTPEPSASPSWFPACLPQARFCTGTVSVVQNWCNQFTGAEACCSGTPPACYWAGNATIFKGSCNGNNACVFGNAATAITVASGSCNGPYACHLIANDRGVTISIGSGSCNTDGACRGIGYIGATLVTIGSNSCIGNDACRDIGHGPATSVTILQATCTNTACNSPICGGMGLYGNLGNQVTCNGCSCSNSVPVPGAAAAAFVFDTPPPTSMPSGAPSAEPSTKQPLPSAEPSSKPQSTEFPSSYPSEFPSSRPTV